MILKARAEKGASSEEGRSSSSSVLGFTPLMAGTSVGVCVAGNLLQFFLLPVLHSARFNVSFPFASVLLAAVLGLLCRYFRRAKAVSDDNESII